MTCLQPLNPAMTKSVAPVARVAMTVVAHAPPVIVVRPLVPVVLPVPMLLPQTVATSPLRHSVPMPTHQPLSAYVKPRQLQQLTVKENNHVATRSPEIPQRAKRP
jgi:hypothetical protein